MLESKDENKMLNQIDMIYLDKVLMFCRHNLKLALNALILGDYPNVFCR